MGDAPILGAQAIGPVQMSLPRRALSTVQIPGGSFSMGDAFGEGYPGDGETPVHSVTLRRFAMSTTTVTSQQFATFVKATGHATAAEEFGCSAVFHLAFDGIPSDVLERVAGSPWWLSVRGADWRHPGGRGSDVGGLQNHPIVHVAWDDARAYCDWEGVRLPTEAEWEYAARGGLESKRYVWGDELRPRGQRRCNIWQGTFPTHNTVEDGYVTTAAVKAFRPNGFGLFQMAGNVWEWCHDRFAADYYERSSADDPQGPELGSRRVMRGGSYLCHHSYCNRYRVSARSSNTPEAYTGNTGFRVVHDL
ncbi:sulfatase modifying factor 1 (C-alpha-formyglycine- generating enzyme 1) [Rhodococcus sp. 05-340-1]|nr:sulfatase modifying factor 1 (C-alpha-formyglycine- generating enzyme 1) [Rhodococcus sp. 05-340-2]OZD69342.1 sulfatase modifying factor 1 (C-alpha-formyglycine- generating enzyme 1) [Rhodococcus sp. 05-340-1]